MRSSCIRPSGRIPSSANRTNSLRSITPRGSPGSRRWRTPCVVRGRAGQGVPCVGACRREAPLRAVRSGVRIRGWMDWSGFGPEMPRRAGWRPGAGSCPGAAGGQQQQCPPGKVRLVRGHFVGVFDDCKFFVFGELPPPLVFSAKIGKSDESGKCFRGKRLFCPSLQDILRIRRI